MPPKRAVKEAFEAGATIALVNPDKLAHDTQGGIIPAHPCRAGFFGPPGSGKGVAALNLIARMPPFDTHTVLHLDPTTEEYTILDDRPGYRIMGYYDDGVPESTEFDKSLRNLLIIDEIPLGSMSRSQKETMDRLFNYASTHRSLSILLLLQDAFQCPVNIRRTLTHISLWPATLAYTAQFYSRMIGVNMGRLLATCKKHDYITVDMTGDGPRLRKNFVNRIETA